jgi:hypothetical protein
MGWFIVNVLLPIFAPLGALLPFRLFVHALPDRSRRLLHWTTPIKDGQVAWIGLAFNAAGGYEMFNAADGTSWKGAVLLGLAFLGAANILIAALGGVFPVEDELPAGKSPWRHYPAMSASVLLTFLSAIVFSGVHFLA